MTVKRAKSDQYLLRLPPGLRDRIQSYADRHDRSLNAEIVRILEREFPEPWSVVHRLDEAAELAFMLKEGITDERVDRLRDHLHQTLRGIASGQVYDLDDDVREFIRERLLRWDVDQAGEDESVRMDNMDPEEVESFYQRGNTAKHEK